MTSSMTNTRLLLSSPKKSMISRKGIQIDRIINQVIVSREVLYLLPFLSIYIHKLANLASVATFVVRVKEKRGREKKNGKKMK